MQKNDLPFLKQRQAVGAADFDLKTEFVPAGDQPEAIKELTNNLKKEERNQVLLGVTGSGKTFTMAKVIEEYKRPALIMAPNKTLAAQLYGEFKEFFPNNHVEYFVSYYDYYQPEAYVPKTDLYIEKDASINEQIDRMRHAATRSMIEHKDVIVVASVSCLYGLGDVDNYQAMTLSLKKGFQTDIRNITKTLVEMQYIRNDKNFIRGTFRVRGDVLEVFPAHLEDKAWRLSFFGDNLEEISEFDSLTGKKLLEMEYVTIYPNSHHVTTKPALSQAIKSIKEELKERLKYFRDNGKLLEAQRLEEKTRFDLEMMQTTGACKGIENYSRYLTGRKPGEPPPTLFEYLPADSILFVDESHVAVPQIHGMFKGDRSRKNTLSDYGFRLPSCRDNRPLKFEEWDIMRPKTIFVSATPGDWELNQTKGVFTEQVIRPTGLLDPKCEVRPAENQVDNLMHECRKIINKNGRVLVTTLTKKMAEQLTEYLDENGLKVKYMHSDIETIERIEIIRDLRLGKFDVLVGINLLREGLDIPECMLVAILDADKEGFLRSERSLIQTIGRAARNSESYVILYGDKTTDSMKKAMEETKRRRERQIKYNNQNNITPKTIIKKISLAIEADKKTKGKGTEDYIDFSDIDIDFDNKKEIQKEIKKLTKEMLQYAENLNFEKAAKIRDKIKYLEKLELEIT